MYQLWHITTLMMMIYSNQFGTLKLCLKVNDCSTFKQEIKFDEEFSILQEIPPQYRTSQLTPISIIIEGSNFKKKITNFRTIHHQDSLILTLQPHVISDHIKITVESLMIENNQNLISESDIITFEKGQPEFQNIPKQDDVAIQHESHILLIVTVLGLLFVVLV